MKTLSLAILGVLFCFESQAGVRALGAENHNAHRSSSNSDFASGATGTAPVVNLQNTSTSLQCQNSGFTLQKCPAGYVPVFACPQNNNYFRDCCPQGYRYTESNCYEMGLVPSIETCLGFHACQKKETTEQNKTSASTADNTAQKPKPPVANSLLNKYQQ